MLPSVIMNSYGYHMMNCGRPSVRAHLGRVPRGSLAVSIQNSMRNVY